MIIFHYSSSIKSSPSESERSNDSLEVLTGHREQSLDGFQKGVKIGFNGRVERLTDTSNDSCQVPLGRILETMKGVSGGDERERQGWLATNGYNGSLHRRMTDAIHVPSKLFTRSQARELQDP
ncbi:hypothetical protein HAX54_010007 [Datura stramonium]|uniref:Uncharacterized protein n=1 Tax=Datura stramonium TaxID=4076 RepID=A0ABS8TGL2_DATST|nr:hypothetical protein [Datura stramonium]